jgi:hypothetical protein
MPGAEATLFRLSAQLEKARPGIGRARPNLGILCAPARFAAQSGFFSAREASAENGETVASGSLGDLNETPGLRG